MSGASDPKDVASVSSRQSSRKGGVKKRKTSRFIDPLGGPRRKPIPLTPADFNFTEDEVFAEAYKAHSPSESSSVGEHELPQYDSLVNYNVSEEDYKMLLQEEIGRLVKVAKSSGSYLFNSEGKLGTTTKTSYEELSSLVSMIVSDCATITLDNQVLTMEMYWGSPLVVEQCAMNFKAAYSTIIKDYQADDENNTKKKPRFPTPPELCRKLYFQIVDYATGALARFLVRIVASNHWNRLALAILARFAVKLKFIAKTSKQYGLRALERAEEAIINCAQEEAEIKTITIYNEDIKGSGVQEKRVRMQDTDDAAAVFALNSLSLSDAMMGVLTGTLSSLCNPNVTDHGFDNFHHHTVVYETGFDRSLVMVTEFRDGYVSTSSIPAHLEICSRALSLVKDNVTAISTICETRPPSSQSQEEKLCYITLEWEGGKKDCVSDKPQRKDVQTANLDEVVSVLLPLGFNAATTASHLETMIQLSAFLSRKELDEPIQRFESSPFQARCSVQTSLDRIAETNIKHYDTVSISKCGTIGKITAGGDLELVRARTMTDLQAAGIRTHKSKTDALVSSEMLDQYRKEDAKMKKWIFSSTSVTVKCRPFVISTLSGCAVLIIGALVLPFLVKNRLPGVDPFQITTFTWLVVGVILIAAKSRYVSEWPWHDFVRGRVVCHSVDDVADVTGVDRQMILLKLLNNEHSTTLQSRGPFNGMFSRRVEDAQPGGSVVGFSIDVPVQLSTMLASGFIVLKVLSTQGEHLICLDARKKTAPDYANSRSHPVSYLSCMDLPSGDESTKSENDVLYLRRNNIGWYKLVGLYHANAVFG